MHGALPSIFLSLRLLAFVAHAKPFLLSFDCYLSQKILYPFLMYNEDLSVCTYRLILSG